MSPINYFPSFHSPQVNGLDVSNCSHEQAVQVFLGAEEPITVEVRRSGATTTEGAAVIPDELLLGSPKKTLTTTTTTSSIGVQTDDPVFDESPVSGEQIVNIFDECLVPDVDLEVSNSPFLI